MSDQPKRTPGMWEARQRETSQLWGVYPVGLPPDETYDILDGNNEADYRLMAAAPVLLAALEELTDAAASDADARGGCSGNLGARLSAARAVIARASGFEILEPSCVNAAAHVPLPTGYLERRDWTNEKLRTHDQKQCNGCKLWVLWVPIAKPRSKREVAEMMGEEHEDPH